MPASADGDGAEGAGVSGSRRSGAWRRCHDRRRGWWRGAMARPSRRAAG